MRDRGLLVKNAQRSVATERNLMSGEGPYGRNPFFLSNIHLYAPIPASYLHLTCIVVVITSSTASFERL